MTLHLMILQIKDMDFVFISGKPKNLKQKRFMSQLKMSSFERKVSSHLLIPFTVILHYRTSLRDSQTEKHPIY